MIDLWPSVSVFAADIGISERHGQVMRFRASVPPDYWPRMVSAAKRRGIKGVSLDKIAKIRSLRRPLARRRHEARAA